MAAAALRLIPRLLTGLALLAGCAQAKPATHEAEAHAPVPALTGHSPGGLEHDPGPTHLYFVGELWAGREQVFAVQDTVARVSGWYRVGERVGDWEIVGPRNGSLLLRQAARSLLLPLNGPSLAPPSAPSSAATDPTPAAAAPKLTIYADGKLIEGTPDQLPPDVLQRYNDHREALLNAKMPPTLAPPKSTRHWRPPMWLYSQIRTA